MKKNLKDTSIPEQSKLIKWIDDPRRGKATANFSEGVERQIAIRFETLFDRLATLKKTNNGTGSPSEE